MIIKNNIININNICWVEKTSCAGVLEITLFFNNREKCIPFDNKKERNDTYDYLDKHLREKQDEEKKNQDMS